MLLGAALTLSNMAELSICPNTPVQPIKLQEVVLISQSCAQLDASTPESDNIEDERDRSRRSTAPSPEPPGGGLTPGRENDNAKRIFWLCSDQRQST
jgi:hypothetical protein